MSTSAARGLVLLSEELVDLVCSFVVIFKARGASTCSSCLSSASRKLI